MSVLRRAYVQVAPELDGFDQELLAKLKAQDPGSKAGKQIGGQLNRALKRLHLDPIDIQADPRQALAKIEETEARLKRLSAASPTVEIKIKIDQGLAQLSRFKRQLGDLGDEPGSDAGRGFITRFVGALGGGFAKLGQAIGAGLEEASKAPPIAVAGSVLGIALAPTISAGIAGAIVGGAGVGGVVGGVLLAARDPRVKTAGTQLGKAALADLEIRAQGFVEPTLQGITKVRAAFADIGPDLDRIFKSSRFISPLLDGALAGAKKFVAGFADAVDAADPVIQSFSFALDRIPAAIGDTFRLLASDAKVGAEGVDELTSAVVNLIELSGQLVHNGAQVKGWTDQVDVAIDKGRYWIEDNSRIATSLKDLGFTVDLTADGFKAGSVQAEAYRKATIGTAEAADFATLKQAGMTDAQITAADASGRYRVQLEQQRAATQAAALASGLLAATDKDVTTAQKAVTEAKSAYSTLLDNINPKVARATDLADGLRKATQNLYGAQITATDANEAYEASWDALSASVQSNKRSLDVHTTAGRANRDALEALITSTNEAYFADIAAGTAVDAARVKHDNRIKSIEKESGKLGLNKQATQELITTYGKIPNNKTTELLVTGIQKVADTLVELYVYQRSLAEGIPLASARAALKNAPGPDKKFGGYAEGGYTGDGSMWEPAGVVHRAEYVIPKRATSRLEARNPGALDYMRKTGELPPYAGGGLVAPVETGGLLFRTNVAGAKVPSRAQVAGKVTPDVPAGGMTYKFLEQVARAAFPGIGILSDYRPGARTLTGNQSYHAVGRAVDFSPSLPFAEWVNAKYMRQTKELITPWQGLNIRNGQRYTYSALVENQHNFAGGNAHDHWAMAGGGVIREPVVGVGLRSGGSYSFGEGGRSETVTPGEPAGGDVHFHFHDSVISTRKQAEDMVYDAYLSLRQARKI